MNKEKIIQDLIYYVKKYNENLKNKNIMFIYSNENKMEYIETKFTKSNFMHLTGIKISNKDITASSFFDMCLRKNISKDIIELRKDGTTRNEIISIK